jgi:iron(III) transport system permease protein
MSRAIIAALLLALLGVPLALPLAGAITSDTWNAWGEARRVGDLALNTLGLTTLTLVLALPAGVGLAVVLYRTDLPGRGCFRIALAFGIFVPLPLFALAWQSVGGGGWRPWAQGLLPAAFVHAMAALPWVVWLTGLGLSRIEPELEEDALMATSAPRVLWSVSLRQAAPAIGLAAVWVALQTAGEITVTDMALVRTFAEEVYTQAVAGGPDALGRAVVVALPAAILMVVGVFFLMRHWHGRLSVVATARPPLVVSLCRARWPTFVIVVIGVVAFGAVPLVSLVRQAGGGDAWTLDRLAIELRRAVNLHLPMIVDTLFWAAAAGLLAAGLATAGSWAAIESRWSRRLLFVLAIALWAVPGPILGFGLKETINRLMDVEDLLLAWTTARPIRMSLYELSTPLPVLWAHVARLFPYAVAIVWPAMRDVPHDLREAARVDGASPWAEFRGVVWPATRRAFAVAAAAVSALALGELAASKLVQVPGRQTFAQELFNQMHYGSTATTAALALVQLALAASAAAALGLIWMRHQRNAT